MDSHVQRSLEEERGLCLGELARVERERDRSTPLVAARNSVADYDVIQRIGRRTKTWKRLGQFYGCMGAAFEVKPRGEGGPLLVVKVVLNDPDHGGETRTEADVIEKFRAESQFTGDPERLPLHPNLPFCYRYFVGPVRGLPDLDWMEEFTERDTLCVVMEHIQGTTLQSLAGQQRQGGDEAQFPEAILLSYSEQLLRAVAHLNDHAIVHRTPYAIVLACSRHVRRSS
jgi:serine/threonine protein kinase